MAGDGRGCEVRRQADGRVECSHIPEGHVRWEASPSCVYDPRAAGYRAEARCRCRMVMAEGRKLHESYIEAAGEAERLVARAAA